MPRKTRPILFALVVLAFAIFAYVHSAVRPLVGATPIDLANPCFNFDADNGKLEDIPASIRQWDGQRVTIEGYMIPDQAVHIQRFALVPFAYVEGAPPDINQIVVVTSPAGVDYNPEQIRVTGRLHVHVTKDEGYIVSIYEMDLDQKIQTIYTGPFAKWPWIVVGGIPTIILLELLRRAFKQRRLRLAGHCVHCGYDLRATPTRCPECGLQTHLI